MKKEPETTKEKKQMKQTESSTSNENIMHFNLTDIIFDWDGLLHRLMGDEDIAKEIIDDFLKQIPVNLFAVKKALNEEDLLLVQREAHVIKGASGNVGALALQEIAEQIEIAGEEKDLVKAGSFVAELDTQLEILKNKLAQSKG
ncbi:MAG: Hpt domain-containing protein [Desulfobacteraceae bacterium]|mgnify:CR=1 FL=1|jgi:HPt (histidine-containing phosphotransfer) domain-containing protein|nr:Hpt domain-containing protein [Desulfobacteraceae bacterium]MDH3572858.1 Hpt domain-containing protein [Desulfobacteraceae bacterium]MDH3721497.1 Hpt domain-containing protein [Desulfobacteraceae bacterium]MDH3836151.1 Hpt domain-containing protein [Desulfobacteraceae bacterium]MDH3873720.1 Hpt domain-containing protein [Desulfobacteraceae bacterium]